LAAVLEAQHRVQSGQVSGGVPGEGFFPAHFRSVCDCLGHRQYARPARLHYIASKGTGVLITGWLAQSDLHDLLERVARMPLPARHMR
jgi:hypothetical protein